jgi:hypothetical protein
MDICNYKDLKHKLKKYASNIDANMAENGWYRLHAISLDTKEVSRNTAIKFVSHYGDDNSVYCYRKVYADSVFPWVIVYSKSK